MNKKIISILVIAMVAITLAFTGCESTPKTEDGDKVMQDGEKVMQEGEVKEEQM